MNVTINNSVSILSRTPAVIETFLKDLPDDWIKSNEGPDTWSPYDIVGHLIHGDKTDWIPRMEIILSDRLNKTFEPFDRFAQFKASKGKNLNQLVRQFKKIRKGTLTVLQAKNITENDFNKTGEHPALGIVTLEQLLATWVVHDLGHIAQIARVMAKQYGAAVGPWKQYLPILER
ncbi:MAG TPA: DinB family protein [Bacteroidia bacterium]|jgi:hypothetical protein|nr:DinB family protein [Bacteroidia bacterium]